VPKMSLIEGVEKNEMPVLRTSYLLYRRTHASCGDGIENEITMGEAARSVCSVVLLF
jgi:hypothetical protein